MPLTMQAKLLRVLEEGEVERVGGDKPVRVDARVIVATHRNLEALVKQNAFRQDLFHRIYVFPVALPPLRERKEDISQLAQHFARQVAAQNGWKEKTIEPGAIQELEHYAWPGNVRELRNVVERLLLIAAGGTVTAEDVQLALPHAGIEGGEHGGAGNFSGTLAERVEKFEKETLIAELARNAYHMTNAARALGLERSHLYKKCQQLGIDPRELRKTE
jgi:two-component system nitrogen regulation response regulator NtrX